MSRKTPERDSILVLKGEEVDLTVEYESPGPVGVTVLENSEVVLTRSLSPSSTDFTLSYPVKQAGRTQIQVQIDGLPKELAENVMQGGVQSVDVDSLHQREVRLVDEEWQIVGVEEDELYQTDLEFLTEVLSNMLALYSAGVLGRKAMIRLRVVLRSVASDSNDPEITTLDEFQDLEDLSAIDDEDSN